MLEEQWQPAGASRPLLWLGVSKGFSYTYDPEAPKGSRITSMSLNGTPISPTGSYRVTVNSFLAAGGDNFATLAGGTDRVTTGDNDLTMLVDYLAANSPVTADPAPRSAVGRPRPGVHHDDHRPAQPSADRCSGLTCLDNATITGPVTVLPGASLVATGGSIAGPVTATGSELLHPHGTAVAGRYRGRRHRRGARSRRAGSADRSRSG